MKTLKLLIQLGIGTLILSIIGLYNGYPLVYSDTGTYLYSGFDLFVPVDRPIVYGLLIRFFSFKYSAWFIILFQNILTAFILYEVLKSFYFETIRLNRLYLTILLFLTLFTGIGWYSNQLMPDFFAPILILTIYLFIAKDKMSFLSKIALSIILIISSITHFSHLIIGLAIIFTIILIRLIFRKQLEQLPLKRLLLAAAVLLSSWVVLPTVNYLVEKQFILSKGSHVFMMASLDEKGILKHFLDDNCSSPDFQSCKLCQLKDSLPDNIDKFIWWENSIVNKTGGWEKSKDEYNKIIKAIHKRPKYLLSNIFQSTCYGLVQLTKNKIGEGLSAYNEGSAPYGQIRWRFPYELNNYLNSRQNKWNGANLKLDTLNTIHLLILIVSLFLIIWLFSSPLLRKLNFNSLFFLVFVMLSIVINSFVTAGLSSPYDRYQTRVVWLLPLALIVVLVKNYKLIAKGIKDKC
ncbi:MAG TPA: hypothetical protein PLA24_10115 [Tenuifilaceae bacterium]|nr:hypothetical protein [Tenuifilaceae bacterium]